LEVSAAVSVKLPLGVPAPVIVDAMFAVRDHLYVPAEVVWLSFNVTVKGLSEQITVEDGSKVTGGTGNMVSSTG
jgi:hypothetical protein